MPDTTELKPTAIAPLDKTPVKMGLAPTTLEEGWRMAQMLSKSELIPKNFRNKPEDVLVAIQMGIEIGFAPMQALQSVAVINGRPGVWGAGFLALIMASPLYQDHDEYYEVGGDRRVGLVAEDWKKDDTAAVCTFWRRGKTTPVSRRFTVAQAKKAGLLTKEGPWQSYPDRMLAMRARGFAGNDAFPDLLRGIRAAEELHDIPVEDAPLVRPTVRRLSESQSAPGNSAVADPPASAVVPLPAPADVVLVGQVAAVDHLLAIVTLTSGECLEVEEDTDVAELGKFVGSPNAVRLTCRPVASGLVVRSFVISD